MLSVVLRSTTVVGLVKRTYATAATSRIIKRPSPETPQIEGPLRPHLNVQINTNHGLYAFFRKRTKENSYQAPAENGPAEYVALEQPVEIASGKPCIGMCYVSTHSTILCFFTRSRMEVG